MLHSKLLSSLLLFSSAFILSLALTPLSRRLAFRLGALDRGEAGRRQFEKGMPRLGGAAIFIAFALPLLFLLLLTFEFGV